jgi:hypothetical protein
MATDTVPIPSKAWPPCQMRHGSVRAVVRRSSGRWRSRRRSGMKRPTRQPRRWVLSRRQVYVLIRRARQGSGLVTDLVPGQSGGGKGKGRLPEPVERIIRELLQKRFLTKQKRSLAAFHREVAQVCKLKSCGCRRATPWPCGSPASIRARSLAGGKARMRPATCKVWRRASCRDRAAGAGADRPHGHRPDRGG